MNDKKQRNAALFSVFLLLLSMFPFSALSYAEEKSVDLQVTNASLATTDGTEITSNHPVTPGEDVNVTLGWQIQKNTLLENGMKAVYTLPKQMKFVDATGSLADNMGNYQVKDQVLTMVFTKNYETATTEEGKLEATTVDYEGVLTLTAKSYQEKSGSEVVKFGAGVQPLLYYGSTPVVSSEVETKKETSTTLPEGQKTTTESTEESAIQEIEKAGTTRRAPMELNGTYNIIKNMVIKDKNKNEINVENPLVDPTKVTLSFDWFLENGWDVIPEDTYTFNLPEIFELYNAITSSPLTTADGTVYGHFSVTKAGKLTITFANGINSVDDRAGSINIVSAIDKEKLKENDEIKTGIYGEDGKEVIIKVTTDSPDIQKQGSIFNDNITWTIIFNSDKKSLTDVVLNEYLPTGTVYSYINVFYNDNSDSAGTPIWKTIRSQDTSGGPFNWKSESATDSRKITFSNNWKIIDKEIKIVLYTKTNDNTLVNYPNRVTINGSNFLENEANASVTLDESENYKRLLDYDLTTGVISWEVKVQSTKENAKWWDKTYSSENYQAAMHYFDKDSFVVTKDGDVVNLATNFKQSASMDGDTNPTYVEMTGLEKGSYVIKYKTIAKTIPIVPGTKIINYANSEKGSMGGEFTLKPSTPETAEKLGITKKADPVIDYNNDKISWKATINKNGVRVKDLVITDVFQNAGGQPYAEYLVKDSLKVYAYDKGNESGKVLLTEDVDYTFASLSSFDWGTDRGFKLTMNDSYQDTSKVFYLEYVTVVDNEKHQELWPYSNVVGNYIYAGFIYGDGNDETTYYEDAFGSITIWGYYKQGGGKTGLFMEAGSIEYNSSYPFGTKESDTKLESDKIYWNIILNMYKVKLPVGTVIKDLPDSKLETPNHKVDTTSYQIFNISYHGDDNKKIKLGAQWELNVDYKINTDGHVELLKETSSPFAVYLITDVTGYTNSYGNTATMAIPNGKEYTVEGTVKRQTNDRWISKSGAQVSTDSGEGTSSIAWEVQVNKRGRRLTNATITDTISYGKHTYKKDADGNPVVKIYEAKLSGNDVVPTSNEPIDASEYTVTVTNDVSVGTQTLTVTFKDEISKPYVLRYETVVDEYISGSEQVSNKATITGDEVAMISVEKEVEVKYTTGSGTSSGKTSSLTIAKVADDAAKTPLKATFDLYRGKGSNREDSPLLSDIEVDGTLTIQNLRNGWYSLKEVAGPDGNYMFDADRFYEVEVVSKEEANATDIDITIVNHEIIAISGEKTWAGEVNESTRPDSIKVSLVTGATRPTEHSSEDIVAGSTKTITPDQDDKWTYSWTDLRKYDDEGKEITYWVVEEAVEGYETTYDGNDITNTRTPDTYKVNTTKTWNHGDNKAEKPSEIEAWLVYGESREDKDAKEIEGTRTEITEKDGWTYEWTLNPDEYEKEKVWVVEAEVTRYETMYDGNDITNTWIAPELYTVKGEKHWNHGDNKAEKPSEIEVSLVYGDTRETGEAIADSKKVVKADKEGNWTYEWTLNPDEYEKEKVWVVEAEVTRYETMYDGNDITNTWIAPELYTVKGEKHWNHRENPKASQPKEIQVWLVYGESRKDGKKIADSEKVVKADKEGNWSYEWTLNPDKYPNVDDIWVVEDKVEGYLTAYDKDSYDITNSWIEPEVPVESTEPSTTEPSTTEPSTTEPSTTEPSTTEPSTTEPSTTEPSTTEPSTTEPSTTEPSTTEPSTTEPSTTEPSTTEPSTTEPSTTEPSTTEPSTTEPSTTEPSTTEPSTTEPSTTEPSTTEPSTTEPSTTDTSDPSTVISSTNRPTLPDTKNPTTNNPTETPRKQLPKTGEIVSRGFFSIIGLVILALMIFLYRRNHREKNQG